PITRGRWRRGPGALADSRNARIRRICFCSPPQTPARDQSRCHCHRFWRRRQDLRWISVELCQTTGATEEIFFAVVQRFVACSLGIYIHPADWILWREEL